MLGATVASGCCADVARKGDQQGRCLRIVTGMAMALSGRTPGAKFCDTGLSGLLDGGMPLANTGPREQDVSAALPFPPGIPGARR